CGTLPDAAQMGRGTATDQLDRALRLTDGDRVETDVVEPGKMLADLSDRHGVRLHERARHAHDHGLIAVGADQSMNADLRHLGPDESTRSQTTVERCTPLPDTHCLS